MTPINDIETIIQFRRGWITSTEIAKCISPERLYVTHVERQIIRALIEAGKVEMRWTQPEGRRARDVEYRWKE